MIDNVKSIYTNQNFEILNDKIKINLNFKGVNCIL